MRALLLSLVFLSACATSPGPVGAPAFPALVAAIAPDALVYGPGAWTPGSRRVLEFANTGGGSVSTLHFKDGVTVITPAGLSFLEWDGQTRSYVTTLRLARGTITPSLATLGASCALIVQENADASFHRFEFVRGAMNDCATARRALAALS